MTDIEPVEVRGREVTINPIAMEYGERYRFPHMGSIWCAIKHRNESVEMYIESWYSLVETAKGLEWDSHTLRVEDCRKTYGFLGEGRICGAYSGSPLFYNEVFCKYHGEMYG